MTNKQFLGLMLASSLSLSALVGCSTAPLTGTGQASAASTNDSSMEAAAAFSEERSMDDDQTLANQESASASAYGVLDLASATSATATTATATTATTTAGTVGATAGATSGTSTTTSASATSQVAVTTAIAAKIKAGQALAATELSDARTSILAALTLTSDVRVKVQARETAREATIKSRLDKLADQRAKLRAAIKASAYVAASDGTSKRSLTFDEQRTVNGATVTRHATLTQTVQTDSKALLAWHADFNQTLANGTSRVSTRDKTLLADGSYLVVFHSVLTLPNGRTRTADWNKVISADGAIVGNGLITWKDKAGAVVRTATLTLGGDEDQGTCKTNETGATLTMALDGQITLKEDDGKAAAVDADSAISDAATAGDTGAAATASVSTSASVGTSSGK